MRSAWSIPGHSQSETCEPSPPVGVPVVANQNSTAMMRASSPRCSGTSSHSVSPPAPSPSPQPPPPQPLPPPQDAAFQRDSSADARPVPGSGVPLPAGRLPTPSDMDPTWRQSGAPAATSQVAAGLAARAPAQREPPSREGSQLQAHGARVAHQRARGGAQHARVAQARGDEGAREGERPCWGGCHIRTELEAARRLLS